MAAILVVDDDASVRALAHIILEGRGYRVLVADGSRRALQIARAEPGPIDLLVTDLVMPGMDGAELGRQLRALRPATRVLYMTALAVAHLAGHTVVLNQIVLDPEVPILVKPFSDRGVGTEGARRAGFRACVDSRRALATPGSSDVVGRGLTMHRILIVDDESTLRETVAAILSRDGYAVNTAADGAEALRLLDLHRYDLVLSDLRMPELDGPQLYDAIQHRCRPTMPAVVFMTGLVGDSIAGALPPGALVLEKPFSLTTLCETVEQLLATRWGESGE